MPARKLDAHLTNATEELDNVVEATEATTSEICKAAEEIQEVVWTLRERGNEVELCDMLYQRVTDIYTACSFEDITGQRTAKVVQTLRFIDQRINAMIEILGVDDIASRLAGHRVDGGGRGRTLARQPATGRTRSDVDLMLKAAGAKPQGETGPAAPGAQGASVPLRSEVAAGAFEPPEPLTLARLDAIKRAALFG